MVYNIHVLTHLVSAAKHYGQLDSWSAFPFENHLRKLKNAVRSPNKPLVQIVNRIKEAGIHERIPPYRILEYKTSSPDNVILTVHGIIMANSFSEASGNCTGYLLALVKPIYDYPYPSSNFNVGIYRKTNIIISSTIKIKCVSYPMDDGTFGIIPMTSSIYFS